MTETCKRIKAYRCQNSLHYITQIFLRIHAMKRIFHFVLIKRLSLFQCTLETMNTNNQLTDVGFNKAVAMFDYNTNIFMKCQIIDR